MSLRHVFCACTIVAIASSAPEAAAQTAQRNAAVALFDEAESLMSAGKYAEACPKYAESYRLDPQLGALLHLADCYEQNRQLASAWATFKDAADVAQRREDERLKHARERVSALEPRLSRLRIVVADQAEAGLEITRDGIVLGTPLWGSAIPVDSGEHVVRASAPGKVAWTGTVRVDAEGKTESIAVPRLADAAVSEPEAAAQPGPMSPKAAASPVLETGSGSLQPVLGFTSLGLGAVSLGVGVVFMVKRGNALDERDELCPNNRCANQDEITKVNDLTDDAKQAATLGTIGLVAGGVFATAGVVLILTSPSSPQRVAIAPALGSGFRGVKLTAALW